ncbi:hypothetical protein Airi02_007420 [Actinoallomurus iriomotensis]|uniref:Uncharacterized protein n=1 Tax=Actinoallomurus iriomotensis TaxID=478107 RepID=A0A9W6RUF8_9ACTN|nr:hypothetical protein Airi02_007420 [Actinoallomurus iriomotensis]
MAVTWPVVVFPPVLVRPEPAEKPPLPAFSPVLTRRTVETTHRTAVTRQAVSAGQTVAARPTVVPGLPGATRPGPGPSGVAEPAVTMRPPEQVV